MKVLLVGSALFDWGGIERYLVNLSEGLLERGHDVVVSLPPGSPLDSRITARKAHIALKGQFNFTRLAAYMRLYRREKFDVVNVHFSPDFIVPAVAARLARQRNLILTRHVSLYWKPSRVRRYTRLYDGFIAVSDAVKKRLVDSGVPDARIAVAKAGCHALVPTVSRESMRQQLAISGFAAGFFGRIVDDKGVKTIAEAAPHLPPETFHVFGDGPLLKELRAHPNGVRYHGKVEDVANYMNAMDIVVAPSLWEEAFCYSALEAMTLGKPIVATKSGGLPELITHGETGLLFEKRDAAGLAEAVKVLAADTSGREQMGKAAMESHRSFYTIPHMAERMEAAYQSFVKS
jgi:glycosyltransferase involved in cell wall biosynthesis